MRKEELVGYNNNMGEVFRQIKHLGV